VWGCRLLLRSQDRCSFRIVLCYFIISWLFLVLYTCRDGSDLCLPQLLLLVVECGVQFSYKIWSHKSPVQLMTVELCHGNVWCSLWVAIGMCVYYEGLALVDMVCRLDRRTHHITSCHGWARPECLGRCIRDCLTPECLIQRWWRPHRIRRRLAHRLPSLSAVETGSYSEFLCL